MCICQICFVAKSKALYVATHFPLICGLVTGHCKGMWELPWVLFSSPRFSRLPISAAHQFHWTLSSFKVTSSSGTGPLQPVFIALMWRRTHHLQDSLVTLYPEVTSLFFFFNLSTGGYFWIGYSNHSQPGVLHTNTNFSIDNWRHIRAISLGRQYPSKHKSSWWNVLLTALQRFLKFMWGPSLPLLMELTYFARSKMPEYIWN